MKPFALRTVADGPVQRQMQRAAFRVLRRRLNWRCLMRVGASVMAARLRREPFGGMDPPADKKDRLSRIEIGDAVLLYRALRRRMPQEQARDVLREVIHAGAFISFDYLLSPMAPEDLGGLGESERAALVRENLDRFPNADAHIEEAASGRVAFTVTHCRFPALLAQLGHPELAPLFCGADEAYFEERLGVRFSRPQTIAQGADTCPFRLEAQEQPRVSDRADPLA